MFLDLLAVFFFLIAWSILTAIVLKRGRNNGDIFVTLFFLLGVLSFTIYSVKVGEVWFIILNGISLVLAAINFYYIPHKFKKMERELKNVEEEVILNEKSKKRR